MNRTLKVIPALLILTLGILGWKMLSSQRSETESAKPATHRWRAPSANKHLQQTLTSTLKAESTQVTLTSHGIVTPSSITTLTPQVSGIISHISRQFESGSYVEKGEILAEIDPCDLQSQLASAKASLARVEAALVQEQARAAQALRNWQDIGFDTEPNALVLRKPQLKEAEANVAAQRAALEQAERNLERSKIRAPYNARIRTRSISIGQSVSAGTQLGEIFATNYAEVRLPLSAKQLEHIDLSHIEQQPIPVTLVDTLQKQTNAQWEAQIVRIEGELDPNTRELFVIARIKDPFNQQQHASKLPLRMNQPVAARITGKTLTNAVAIPRSAVYRNDAIILIRDGKIHHTTITPLWSTIDTIYVENNDLEGAQLATSRLTFAPEGTPILVISDAPKSQP